MSYAVLLYFDPQTEDTIKKLMEELSKQMGTGELLPAGFRPHLTLTGFETPSPEGFLTSLNDFANKTASLPVSFAAIGTFPTDQGVVYLAPVVSNELLDLHRKIYQVVGRYKIESNTYFTPGVWIPHCTVAYGLNPERAGQAIAMMLKKNVLISGELVAIGLTEFLPIKELCIYPLRGDLYQENS